ncbi:MAG: hypothetical protein RIB55_15445 [Nitratireductor sp.]
MEGIEEWNIAASLAVEQYLDYRGAPPEGWLEALVEHGVGERLPDGEVRLNALGHRYRERLMHRR